MTATKVYIIAGTGTADLCERLNATHGDIDFEEVTETAVVDHRFSHFAEIFSIYEDLEPVVIKDQGLQDWRGQGKRKMGRRK